MISLGSRDGRKGIGLGYGGGGEMEETELEEGEACYYQNDDESNIDPDALSYIDEKLQDVLGHFQKDFEGGVSAENLGSKFGGYGSFLPAYQRSPAWSHSRTSPDDRSHDIPRSPNDMHLEVACQNSITSSTASAILRPGSAIGGPLVPVQRAPVVNDQTKKKVPMPALAADGSRHKGETVGKSANPTDQKTLKVRIKVGTENLPTQKNAEIYSGLGLDVSPSSSLDGSPMDSEGLSHELRDTSDESPRSILQIMTSFLMNGSILLSPLSDDLIRLLDKDKIWGENGSKTLHRAGLGSSTMMVDVSDFTRGQKVLEQKRLNSSEKDAFVKLPHEQGYGPGNNVDDISKKEADIDTLACEELVSNALKLPLLSDSYSSDIIPAVSTSRTANNSRPALKAGSKGKFFSDQADKTVLEPVSGLEINRIEKSNEKENLSREVCESTKQSQVPDGSENQNKERTRKGERSDMSVKVEPNKERKILNNEISDLLAHTFVQKGTFYNENSQKMTPGTEQLPSGGKKKSKDSHDHVGEQLSSVSKKKFKEIQSTGGQCAELPNNVLMVDSSLAPKNRKTSYANSVISKSESRGPKKDNVKAGDRYKDFFGEIEFGQEDDEIPSEDMPSMEKLKDSELVEKQTKADSSCASKERSRGEKTDKAFTSGDRPRITSNMPAMAGNGPNSDAAQAALPSLVKEDWVCCDKCHTWRLLPLGMSPESLPEKWLCSMLNWLPGMNRCGISEEETTKALRALYQVPAPPLGPPAPDSQHPGQFEYSGGSLPGVPCIDSQSPRLDNGNLGLQTPTMSGKKKSGSKNVSTATSQDSLTHYPNSQKNLQGPAKFKSSNCVDHSPLVDEHGHLHVGQSSSSVIQKQRHKQREHEGLQISDAGTLNSKTKNKRENDLDTYGASKRSKAENLHYDDENWTFDIPGAKTGRSSIGVLSNGALDKDQRDYNHHPKDLKGDVKKNIVSSKNSEIHIPCNSNDGSLHLGKGNFKDSMKKRKGNENQESKINKASISGAVFHPQEQKIYMEETCENDHRKDKKARLSKSDQRDISGRKASDLTERKSRNTKGLQMGQDLDSSISQRSIDAPDSLKRDVGSAQPPMAATSSSSKVSSSRRNRTSFQEVKGSPVESVSSSPLRNSGTDKFTSTRMNHEGKDDFQDAGHFPAVSPRRSSEGEDDSRSDRSGNEKKNETLDTVYHAPAVSSVLDFQERNLEHMSMGTVNVENACTADFAAHNAKDNNVDSLGPPHLYACKMQNPGKGQDEERRRDSQFLNNGSHSKKSGKGSSSRSKDKNRCPRSELDKGKSKASDSSNGSIGCKTAYDGKPKTGKNKLQEKSGIDFDTVEKSSITKKDLAVKTLNEIGKGETKSKSGGDNEAGVRVDMISSHHRRQGLPLDRNEERSSKKLLSDNPVVEISERDKSFSSSPTVRGENESAKGLQPVSSSHKDNGTNLVSVDVMSNDHASTISKQGRKVENLNGNLPSLQNPTPNTQRVKDLDAPTAPRKDSSNQAATNALKEAKDLKHLADRLKTSGSSERVGIYFQAALKFLHGASLLELSNSDTIKHNEMLQSRQIYSSTAKLCEFCAHEYEKSKDMAAAALAYKCMEVAHMRVIYSSNTNASKDRNELQTALHIVPPGESPSSSASDVDNLNNQVSVDKVALSKSIGSPQVAGTHVITARNQSSFIRLLNFAQEVNYAMEASRKSRVAFAAASPRTGEAHHRDGITSVKRALDFNFQDVDGLLRLVRVAMEAISR